LRYDVLVYGPVFCDIVFTGLPAFPELGKEIFADRLSVSVGGSAIVAAGLKRLGAHVGLIADLGDDAFSQVVREMLDSEGLDRSLVREHEYPLPRTTVALSYPEDRAFVTRFQRPQSPPDLETLLGSHPALHLHIGSFLAAEESPLAAAVAHNAGMTVSMDPGWDEVALRNPRLHSLVAEMDVFLPNRSEVCHMGESDDYLAIATTIRAKMRKGSTLVVKGGEAGATAFANGDELFQAQALPVNPVDTTGAGDAFDAGYLFAYLNGQSIEQCLRYATVCGSLSTQGVGGVDALPTLAEAESWLKGSP
jgi:hypothetical protein